jgi:solute carrier family 9B (sodium/hydrogen exchanger), member 1/2
VDLDDETSNADDSVSSKTHDRLFHVGGYVLMGAGFYSMLIFLLGTEMTLPNGPLWSCLLLWIVSYLAGLLCEHNGYVNCPALLGQLISGLILRNLPDDETFFHLPSAWSTKIKAFGLACIFLRAGLEIDLQEILKQGLIATRLTVMPGLTEAMTVGLMGMAIFDMPFLLGCSMGFILAAVSPAVVVGGMFNLQSQGYGVLKGIPTLVVAAASFDDVVALTGFSIFSGLSIPNDHGILMSALHAPIEIFGASILGWVIGHILGCTRLFDKHYKRLLATLFLGLMVMFGAVHFHYSSMGALGCLCIGFITAKRWGDRACGDFLALAANTHWQHEVEHDIASLWKHVAQPLLFATIGSSIDFSEIDNSSIPSALLIIVIGSVVRVLVAICVTWGNDLS